MQNNYAELIFESILKEDANQPNVIDAIKKRYEVGITYKADDDPKGSGYRIIQPVAYGKSSSGNLVIRAFQPYGDTKSKTPSWKMFRLDRIEEWKPKKANKFKKPPIQGENILGSFNPNGDKGMSEVYLVANFNGMKNDALMKYNKARHDQKVKENPYYDLQRNIKKSINISNVDYFKKNLEDWQKSAATAEFRKGNGQSLYDMSRVTDFGDDNSSETVGPVRKGNTETSTEEPTRQLNYSGAINNGPMYKQNMQQQNVNPDEYEDEFDNNEEGTEENIEDNNYGRK